MSRPPHLPEFARPPLDEVVLGVQFEPVPGFKAVDTRSIWDIYKGEFPKIEEHPLLAPQFETFGGPSFKPSIHFELHGLLGSRLWFVSKEENHLLQFQSDRLLLNWRRNPNSQDYPRFEGIAATYLSSLSALAAHFSEQFSHRLSINQAEVTYINIVPVEEFSDAGRWFNLWSGQIPNVEGLNLGFSEVVRNPQGIPFARLSHALQSVFTLDSKQKAFKLSLTFRGKPDDNSIESAMSFLRTGREAIVTRFKHISTPNAHDHWGLMQ